MNKNLTVAVIIIVLQLILIVIAVSKNNKLQHEMMKLHISAEKVVVTTYNYDRLTPDTCMTEYECRTADIVHKFDNGELYEVVRDVPVIEPIPCDMRKANCREQNQNAGEDAMTFNSPAVRKLN